MSDADAEDFSLNLDDLRAGAVGITPPVSEGLAQAASVCLDEQGHRSPVAMQIHEAQIHSGASRNRTASLLWSTSTGQMRNTWNDDEEATEKGACGVAALLARQTKGLEVVRAARKGRGFDYWLGSSGNSLVQEKARMEVSGIRKGTTGQVTTRLNQKKERILQHPNPVPWVIVVFEFGSPQARVLEQ